LKLKWEQAIALSEKNNQLHSFQYGSRQKRRSIDPVFLGIILQEVSRFTRTPFVKINYNAQAFYDKIILDIAFALSRKNGVHNKIIQLVRETMNSSKYYIKLESHVTLQSYCNKDRTPLYGKGQGSGCSPHIWAMLSSELFHLYTENLHGFYLTDPYGSQSTSLHVIAYVDDVNTHYSFQKNRTINQMLLKALQAAQAWGNILHLSGGKLSPNKCNYYAALWKYAYNYSLRLFSIN
jgi:Reverse transcriptase (RNA-dependent DNA polymerase)